MRDDRKSAVPALERGLRILELLPRSREGLTLSQMARYLHLPKSSVHCLLSTLEASGYVYRNSQTSKYSVSLRICALAHLALNGIGLREQSKPHLRRLAEKTGMTVHLGVLERGSSILIDKVSLHDGNRVATWIGKQLDFHCTALGKALAAHVPEEQLEALIRDQGLLRHNDNTICSMKRLKQELALVRQRGYSMDDEEEEINFRCIGAPVLDSAGHAIAAISIVGTTLQVHEGNLQKLAREVIGTAEDLSSVFSANEHLSIGAAAMGMESGALRSNPAGHEQRAV